MTEACKGCGAINHVPAHDQKSTHHYTLHYPEHGARKDDPHYKDFEAYRRRTRATAVCAIGEYRNDYSDCHGPLELHHDHIEWALQNSVDLAVLEAHYPGVSDPDTEGEWLESAANLEWLCEYHHRGHGGVHVASSSDFEGEHFVQGLIT